MDPIRFGLAVRALRRRRGLTQAQLAKQVRLSASTISRIERGGGDALAVSVLVRVVGCLGARVRLSILWQGEELDRLLDAGHAELVEAVAARLGAAGWVVVPEATFSIYGERGSIDILAWHPASGQVLVVEVKSVVPDVQATLSGLDRKARLAARVARDHGWAVCGVSRVLVLPDERTARRRLARFASTFDLALPARTVEVRRWIEAPAQPISGVWFVACAGAARARHRVSSRSTRS